MVLIIAYNPLRKMQLPSYLVCWEFGFPQLQTEKKLSWTQDLGPRWVKALMALGEGRWPEKGKLGRDGKFLPPATFWSQPSLFLST